MTEGTHVRRSRRLGACLLALSSLCCRANAPSSAAADTSQPEPAASAAPAQLVAVQGRALADMVAPYPHGRWRLAPQHELQQVRLWASHILVRHREVSLGGVVFGPLEPLRGRPSERSRDEARTLAESIAAEAQAAPERFAELARERSEDAVTQTTGGSLGAINVTMLLSFPQVIDAFAALQPGQVSQVVETDYGFHVFQPRPVPPERSCDGAHIVIGHDDAPWLAEHLARGPVPRRSRAEALALATSLYERARAAPRDFAQLAAGHSEHIDAEHGGDFGAWSTQRPDGYSRELELLLELPVYGVAPPIDTLFGIEIVQRTPARPRGRVAVELIRLGFDPALEPTAPGSKQAVWTLGQQLAQQLAGEPRGFAALQAQYCCSDDSLVWTEKQMPSAFAYAAERMAVGEISSRPIEFASSYVIARRTDAGLARPEPALKFALPAPAELELERVVSRLGRESLQAHLASVAVQVSQALGLDPARAADLRGASQLPAELSEHASEDDKRAALRNVLERVRLPLGPEGHARYLGIAQAHFTEWVLEQPL